MNPVSGTQSICKFQLVPLGTQPVVGCRKWIKTRQSPGKNQTFPQSEKGKKNLSTTGRTTYNKSPKTPKPQTPARTETLVHTLCIPGDPDRLCHSLNSV